MNSELPTEAEGQARKRIDASEGTWHKVEATMRREDGDRLFTTKIDGKTRSIEREAEIDASEGTKSE